MQFDFAQFLSPGILTAIGLLLFLVVTRLMAKKFLSKAEIETVERIAKIAVRAAEQLVKNGKLEPDKRLSYAFDLVNSELRDRKIQLTIEFIMAMIESNVLDASEGNLNRRN